MIRFQDHFSGHAGDYAAYRPTYPSQLFRFLAQHCDRHECAWDCATGSGQAAVALAAHFNEVIATDASATQIAAAKTHECVDYRVVAAERCEIEDASVDLVTIAQALHWFDLPSFFAEASRVLRKGALLAAWSYEECRVSADVDIVLSGIFSEIELYWPEERKIVADRYRSIQFPWREIAVPEFDMTENWSVEQALGYMRTWSAAQRYALANSSDALSKFDGAVRAAWGDERRIVRWPLTIRVCRR